jgi:hypothetical protein
VSFSYRADSFVPPTPYEWAQALLKAEGPDVDTRVVYRAAYQQVPSDSYAMLARDAYAAAAYEAATGQPF